NLTTGLSSGYMVSQGNYEYKPYDFNAISGIGANFTITRRLSFIAQPSVKFNIPIENNFFARRTFLSYALYTGLTFSIK
ncbi:MAG: hypothetical protein HY738_13085, partial [Bacteroidia bacterium]|nr:hypothetical protein [Bacteroidia bacterium]